MGVSYDPKYGIQRIEHSCGAKVGDIVKARDASWIVVGQDDYGCFVCENMDPRGYHDYCTFDDLDIDEVIKPDDARFQGEGI